MPVSRKLVLAASTAVLILPASAFAQQDGPVTIEEVVVTAEKRAQNVQDVPIAISVIGRQEIADKQVQGIEDMARLIPSVDFGQEAKDGARPKIRGFAPSDNGPGYDNPVGVFIDGIYFGRAGDFGDLNSDVERIEVLRGPQGTLFGKNVTAGAFNITTIQPTNTPEAVVSVGYGNYNDRQLQVLAAGPIIADKLLGKVSASIHQRDGLVKNLLDGSDLDTIDQKSLRGQLVFLPNEDWRISLSAFGTWVDEAPKATYIFGDPITLPGILYTSGPGDTYMQPGDTHEKTAYGTYAHVEYSGLPWATFRSITGWYRSESFDQLGGIFGTSFPILAGPNPATKGVTSTVDSEQFTQEFQLVSPSDQPLTWVAGAFWQHLEEEKTQDFTLQVPCAGGPGAPTSSAACLLNSLVGYPALPARDTITQKVTTDSWAVFGQVRWAFAPKAGLTLGGRYSSDEKTGLHRNFGQRNFVSLSEPPTTPGGTQASLVVPLNFSGTAFTPKAVLDYKPSEDVMWYVSVARGYKSGGYAFRIPNTASAKPFESEFVWNYEAGMKAEFFGRRVQFNPTVFRADFKNQQGTSLDPFSGQLRPYNIPKVTVMGLELDSQFVVTDDLRLKFAYAYTEGDMSASLAGPAQNLVGVSKHAASLAIDYEVPAEVLGGRLRLGADGRFNTSQRFLGAPSQTTGDFSTVDARMVWSRGPWQVSLWGKNLTDERTLQPMPVDESVFFQNFADFNAGKKVYRNTYADPRFFGVTLTWRPEL